MNANELQALGKIEGRLGRLEALQEANVRTNTELTASVNRLVEKLDKSDDIAREALDKAKSAHHRIDDTMGQVKSVQDDIKWLWRAVLGAIITGVIGGAIALLWKGIGA
ncbi:hemolysin XhlA family protein [Cohnella massiliensis]|uniref:hemolysin XhlA family protein n=1 Tax=Cohnella massiliensis TaxID=1816691 RepID=UPI00318326A8